ncbi:MAG TPA: hypothetical protein VHL11_19855, partial [Phototrophicaceae bacterium]|nr:hypothetical protein [Phototrophicaceae bacterium]
MESDADSSRVTVVETVVHPDEDTATMLAAQQDPKNFAIIYEKYFQRIYAYCMRNVNNPDEA